MLGAITGDIVGSIYEGHSIKTKNFDLFNPRRYFTDDTVLTILDQRLCAIANRFSSKYSIP